MNECNCNIEVGETERVYFFCRPLPVVAERVAPVELSHDTHVELSHETALPTAPQLVHEA